MRNIVFIVIAFVLSFSGRVCAGNPVYSDNSLRNDAEKLLVEWVDALLAYQCEGLHPSLDGGILCPACARIHRRIGDTVLPLMYLADKTGNDKYLLAAKKLMKWSHLPLRGACAGGQEAGHRPHPAGRTGF